MQNEVKIGDVVQWSQVPSGAMVREEDGDECGAFTLRIGEEGYVVRQIRGRPRSWQAFDFYETWEWDAPEDVERATIVAIGLTGYETAADLQRLAEIFEVSEQLLDPGIAGFTKTSTDEREYWARRLYDAGFRRGMTAEDAARLLAEAGQ